MASETETAHHPLTHPRYIRPNQLARQNLERYATTTAHSSAQTCEKHGGPKLKLQNRKKQRQRQETSNVRRKRKHARTKHPPSPNTAARCGCESPPAFLREKEEEAKTRTRALSASKHVVPSNELSARVSVGPPGPPVQDDGALCSHRGRFTPARSFAACSASVTSPPLRATARAFVATSPWRRPRGAPRQPAPPPPPALPPPPPAPVLPRPARF